MAITIKEVYVKTTVERNLNYRDTDDAFIRKLVNDVCQKLQYDSLKDVKKNKER